MATVSFFSNGDYVTVHLPTVHYETSSLFGQISFSILKNNHLTLLVTGKQDNVIQ